MTKLQLPGSRRPCEHCPMKQSTRTMFVKHGWRVDRFVHNYLYFRFYYPYVKAIFTALPALERLERMRAVTAPLGRMIFDRYHSKVIARDDTRKILTVEEDIVATSERNKRIVPFKYAHRILLEEADYIAVMDCPCKKSAGAPAPYLNSCIAVGRKLADFWLEHCDKYHARRISSDEALELIAELRAHDHITQAFFKVATGGSTGVICNCHPDTCVSLIATRVARKIDPTLTMNAESGYSVQRDAELCTSCGTCAATCHFDAISVAGDDWSYVPTECMGCELCVERCPARALSLYLDPAKSLPLDLDLVRDELLDVI